jgi:L-cysteine S-thiosulfotransferase
VNYRLKIRACARPSKPALAALATAALLAGSASQVVASGDAGRGRLLVANRQQSLCLLCHQAPIPEERFQGDLGPPLAGVGSRLTAQQLRERLVDSRAVQADSIMPAYGRATGLHNVASRQVGQAIFTEQQIDDVLAYLQTLR